jgi:15-cis-phytoene synthase
MIEHAELISLSQEALALDHLPKPLVPRWLKNLAAKEWKGNSMDYLARHSHSFRYAAHFLPPPYDSRIADIYAFCRFTDDLVDRADSVDGVTLELRLNEWKGLAWLAYNGITTDLPMLDQPLGEMGRLNIPFRYASELIDGVRMDLTLHRYTSWQDLQVYTYRVAGVVGQWLTELVGIHDPKILNYAADLGHAMQLTNILRDVGEDSRSGRIYLPLSHLAKHQVSPFDVARCALGVHSVPETWPKLIEEVMALAEAKYQSALKGIPHLPEFFQKPILTATLVYRDIHRSLRNNGYDNFTQRAYTGKLRKVFLGLKAQYSLPGLKNATIK